MSLNDILWLMLASTISLSWLMLWAAVMASFVIDRWGKVRGEIERDKRVYGRQN